MEEVKKPGTGSEQKPEIEKPKTDAPKAGAAKAEGPKKKDNTLKIVLIVVGAVVGLGILGTIATIIFFGALFNKAADEAGLNNGTTTVKSDDGNVTTNVGEGAKLISGWPTDVPIYEPSTLVASSKSDEASFSTVGKTSKTVADVSAFYKAQMATQGWTVQYESAAADSALTTYQKDNRTASVIITSDPDEKTADKTGFVIAVTTQP